MAEKLLRAAELPVKIEGHTIHPAVRIGIALYPGDGLDKETLKHKADIALYQAKKAGRNRVACNPDIASRPLAIAS